MGAGIVLSRHHSNTRTITDMRRKMLTIQSGPSRPQNHDPAPAATGIGAAHIIMLMLLAAAIYSNTLDAPFAWDEKILITDNTLVHSLEAFALPETIKDHPHYDAIIGRYVGYLSFALNYAAGGASVTGYHIVNIAIHAANSALACLLMMLSMGTPVMREATVYYRDRARAMALFCGALFAAHPLMTEAVTYVFQRHASLAALFYMLTIVLYSSARQRQNRTLYLASILSAALAMKSKENAFTLPLMIGLYELMFFRGRISQRLLRLAPHMATMLIVPLTMMYLASVTAHTGAAQTTLEAAAGAVEEVIAPALSGRLEYLYTQMPVVAGYMKMILLPIGQSIDHPYVMYSSPLALPVLLALLLHASVIGAALWLWLRVGRQRPEARLVAFGIIWFYVALSVESTIIPLQMIITEYRVYLPAAGAFMALTASGAMAANHMEAMHPGARRLINGAGVIIIAALALAAFERNSTWRTELGIWQDAADKNPQSVRPLLHVGLAHERLGDYREALKAYERAMALAPGHAMAHYDAGVIYQRMGQDTKAEAAFGQALRIEPSFSMARNNMAALLIHSGRMREAEGELIMAIELNPWDPTPYHNLSIILLRQARYAEAATHLRRLSQLVPPNADILNKLGIAYMKSGRPDEARRALTEGLEKFPHDSFIPGNLALLEEGSGNIAEAERLYLIAIDRTPEGGKAPLEAIGRLYIGSGRYYDAMGMLDRALRQDPGNGEIRRMREMAIKALRSDGYHTPPATEH